MSFVCGTDFGENATRATEIAARLAAKAAERLTVVHAIELPAIVAGDPFFVPMRDALRPSKELQEAADARLAGEAGRLAKMSGASVVPRLAIATPAAGILEVAAETKPAFIVTGTHGRSAPGRWILGSTADRLARRATGPVLVVREPCDGLEAWSKGVQTLRVLVGVSFDSSFDAAHDAGADGDSDGDSDGQ